jgi:hypothetical protein
MLSIAKFQYHSGRIILRQLPLERKLRSRMAHKDHLNSWAAPLSNPKGDLCKTGIAAPRQRAAALILLENAAVCRHAATMAGTFAEVSVGVVLV